MNNLWRGARSQKSNTLVLVLHEGLIFFVRTARGLNPSKYLVTTIVILSCAMAFSDLSPSCRRFARMFRGHRERMCTSRGLNLSFPTKRQADMKNFQNLVDNEYKVHMQLDGLPVAIHEER